LAVETNELYGTSGISRLSQCKQSCLLFEDNTECGNSDNAFARFSLPLYAILTYKGKGRTDFFFKKFAQF
jgi:hypothetical protein